MDENYYHGTNSQCAKEIVKGQSFKHSKGDEEWLGDGIYAYTDIIYAFKWIKTKYIKKNKNYADVDKKLFKDYSILELSLDKSKLRIFSLDRRKDATVFYKIIDKFRRENEKTKDYSGEKCPDGAVINLMFNEMGFDKYYDAVEYSFGDKRFSSFDKGNSRVWYKEYQICIKNDSCINNIIDRTDNLKFEELEKELVEFNDIRTEHNLSRYKAKEEYRYEKTRANTGTSI